MSKPLCLLRNICTVYSWGLSISHDCVFPMERTSIQVKLIFCLVFRENTAITYFVQCQLKKCTIKTMRCWFQYPCVVFPQTAVDISQSVITKSRGVCTQVIEIKNWYDYLDMIEAKGEVLFVLLQTGCCVFLFAITLGINKQLWYEFIMLIWSTVNMFTISSYRHIKP